MQQVALLPAWKILVGNESLGVVFYCHRWRPRWVVVSDCSPLDDQLGSDIDQSAGLDVTDSSKIKGKGVVIREYSGCVLPTPVNDDATSTSCRIHQIAVYYLIQWLHFSHFSTSPPARLNPNKTRIAWYFFQIIRKSLAYYFTSSLSTWVWSCPLFALGAPRYI